MLSGHCVVSRGGVDKPSDEGHKGGAADVTKLLLLLLLVVVLERLSAEAVGESTVCDLNVGQTVRRAETNCPSVRNGCLCIGKYRGGGEGADGQCVSRSVAGLIAPACWLPLAGCEAVGVGHEATSNVPSAEGIRKRALRLRPVSCSQRIGGGRRSRRRVLRTSSVRWRRCR